MLWNRYDKAGSMTVLIGETVTAATRATNKVDLHTERLWLPNGTLNPDKVRLGLGQRPSKHQDRIKSAIKKNIDWNKPGGRTVLMLLAF